jgi:hypothetical protein
MNLGSVWRVSVSALVVILVEAIRYEENFDLKENFEHKTCGWVTAIPRKWLTFVLGLFS